MLYVLNAQFFEPAYRLVIVHRYYDTAQIQGYHLYHINIIVLSIVLLQRVCHPPAPYPCNFIMKSESVHMDSHDLKTLFTGLL